LLLLAGTVALALVVPRLVVSATAPPEPACWNGLETDPCQPLKGLTGAMWAFDPNQVVAANCDRLRKEDYFVEAEDAWHCTWPDLAVDMFVARFPDVADGPAIWRDVSYNNGFREMAPDTWPRGEALGPGLFGGTPLTKDLDAPLIALCYDDIPYCLELDAMSNRALETAEDRVATLTSHEVQAYLRQLAATPTGDV